MPSAILTSETALFGSRGWFRAANVGTVVLLGVDRHGKISEFSGRLELSGHKHPSVFLGAASTFGFLAAQTVVLDSAGTRHRVGQIAQTGSISQLQFETVTHCHEMSLDAVSFTDLWNVLKRTSAIATSADILIRSRMSFPRLAKQIETLRTRFARKFRSGSHVYCRINRALLNDCLLYDWSTTLCKLSGLAFDFPDALCRVEKKCTLVGLWIISAFSQLQRGFSLKYDGIQYTICTQIIANDDCPRPIARGLCACVEAEEFPEVKLSWSDPSWNPIANGYVISPG